ncbi:MAG TPA: hypothetical protein VHL85_05625 [Burkholderiales bacterium]|nr:hypothetical protein [Burkholderiales bacterium]
MKEASPVPSSTESAPPAHVEPPPAPRQEEPRHAEPHHEEPRREEPRREEPRYEEPRRAEPRIDPKPILEDAGLVMVETDRSKAKVVAPQEEPVNLGRPRRDRPKPPPAQDDDLVQIETKR